MFKKYTELLTGFMRRKPTVPYRTFAILIGALVFLMVLPLLLILAGFWLTGWSESTWPRGVEIAVGFLSLAIGLFFMGWTVLTQWKVGHGTPNPIAPTQKLIIAGPYRLCRNPIQFGASFYFMGLGCLLGNLTIGLFCLAVILIVGSIYHRFFEEKELAARFGEEYLAYRRRTPFLIPRFNSKKQQDNP